MFNLPDGFYQVTNIKTGSWNDHTIWSNNIIPDTADAVKLEFDVIVDVNASCKSLTVNGRNVIVNSGVHLTITGEVSGVILNDGLIAYYPFNGNASDSTGNEYDLIVQGPLLTTSRFRGIEKAYRFNGISDFMNLA